MDDPLESRFEAKDNDQSHLEVRSSQIVPELTDVNACQGRLRFNLDDNLSIYDEIGAVRPYNDAVIVDRYRNLTFHSVATLLEFDQQCSDANVLEESISEVVVRGVEPTNDRPRRFFV